LKGTVREYLDTGYWLEPGAVTVYCIAAAVESGVDMVALTQLPWRSTAERLPLGRCGDASSSRISATRPPSARSDALSWNLPVAAGSISITSMRT